VIERNTDVGPMQDNAFLAYDRIGGDDRANNLTGDEGRDLLIGLDGHDRLDGGAGDDQLVGGNGRDRIGGGAGDDILEGGDGRDVYVIRPGSGHDVISDFSRNDVIDVSRVAAGTGRFRNLDLRETDDGVVLTLADGGTVTFEGLSLEDLDRDDFILSA
jgi:Ca2+-binding RTX toxin-like protein